MHLQHFLLMLEALLDYSLDYLSCRFYTGYVRCIIICSKHLTVLIIPFVRWDFHPRSRDQPVRLGPRFSKFFRAENFKTLFVLARTVRSEISRTAWSRTRTRPYSPNQSKAYPRLNSEKFQNFHFLVQIGIFEGENHKNDNKGDFPYFDEYVIFENLHRNSLQRSFLWFFFKNSNLGLKMNILKFLEIQPTPHPQLSQNSSWFQFQRWEDVFRPPGGGPFPSRLSSPLSEQDTIGTSFENSENTFSIPSHSPAFKSPSFNFRTIV